MLLLPNPEFYIRYETNVLGTLIHLHLFIENLGNN